MLCLCVTLSVERLDRGAQHWVKLKTKMKFPRLGQVVTNCFSFYSFAGSHLELQLEEEKSIYLGAIVPPIMIIFMISDRPESPVLKSSPLGKTNVR